MASASFAHELHAQATPVVAPSAAPAASDTAGVEAPIPFVAAC